jgi:hypothetical protein
MMQFTFSAACAAVIFGPIGLPLTIGVQHCLVGFVLMQCVVTLTTGVPAGVVLAVPSFEVLPFLAKFAVIVSGAIGTGAPGAVLATVLVGSVLVSALSAVLLMLSSLLPVDEISTLLPPPLQAALFSAIGVGLYLLSFDVISVPFAAASLFTWKSASLWVPANLLGFGLWKTSRKTDSPLLFPAFILGVAAVVHAGRLATGTSVVAARAAGWLMADAAGEPCTALIRSLSPSYPSKDSNPSRAPASSSQGTAAPASLSGQRSSPCWKRLVRWDVLASAAAAKQLVCAALNFATLTL